MTAMIRAQALRGYRQLVSDLGGKPARLLHRAGIDPTALDQLTALIGFEDMVALLERSATDLGCPDFGLRLADRQDLGLLGTLAVAMRYSATVGQAARSACKYLYVHTPAIACSLTAANRGQVALSFDILLQPPPPWGQTAEHTLGLAWRILQTLSEGRSGLREVRLPHPPIGSEASYASRFPATRIFQAERVALVIPAADLNLPLSEHHPELHDLATRHLAKQVPEQEPAFQVQVRQGIEALLGTGNCSNRDVASALYMHPRTLQRRLREEGTTFEEIKDDVRRDLARRYLSRPDVPFTQVTSLLDYSEQSTLVRSCRRWFHATPQEIRNEIPAQRTAP